jgi:hypothetical protein
MYFSFSRIVKLNDEGMSVCLASITQLPVVELANSLRNSQAKTPAFFAWSLFKKPLKKFIGWKRFIF